MQYIKHIVWKQKDRIKSAKNANAETTYVLYEHVRDYMKEIVDQKYIHNGKIIVIGGIQINVEPDDYFEPLTCFVMDENGTTDILSEIFEFDTIPKPTASQD